MNPTPPLSLLSPRHNARTLALAVLGECGPDACAADVLRRHLADPRAADLKPADRRLASHLVFGVLRRRLTLATLLAPLINRDPGTVEPWLTDALMLGAFQLCLMTQIPPHAALNETVELAGHYGRLRGKGFLNGVLRACSHLATSDRAGGPASDALPLENGFYRRLSRPLFADPVSRPAEYLSAAFSLPAWVAARRIEREGIDEAYRVGFVFASAAPTTVRVDDRHGSRDDFIRACQDAGFRAEPGRHPACVRLREHPDPRDLPGAAVGWGLPRDESLMDLEAFLGVADGARILAAADPRAEGTFDAAALAPLPSTRTGALGRRPERRHALRAEDVRASAAVLRKTLADAVGRVTPGAPIAYATASLEPEENAEVVRAVADGLGLTVEVEEWFAPGRPGDGGYRARLRNRA